MWVIWFLIAVGASSLGFFPHRILTPIFIIIALIASLAIFADILTHPSDWMYLQSR